MSTDAPPTPTEPDAPRPERERDRVRRRARPEGDGGRLGPLSRADRRSMLRPGDGPMVIFDHVSKVYGPNTVGLDDVSLTIDSGEFVFLVQRTTRRR